MEQNAKNEKNRLILYRKIVKSLKKAKSKLKGIYVFGDKQIIGDENCFVVYNDISPELPAILDAFTAKSYLSFLPNPKSVKALNEKIDLFVLESIFNSNKISQEGKSLVIKIGSEYYSVSYILDFLSTLSGDISLFETIYYNTCHYLWVHGNNGECVILPLSRKVVSDTNYVIVDNIGGEHE